MTVVLFLSLIQLAFGMGLIQCFLPRAVMGAGFGRTTAICVFLALLVPTFFAARLLPDNGYSADIMTVQAFGVLALLFWFAYFISMNNESDNVQFWLVVSAASLQLIQLLFISDLLATVFLVNHPEMARGSLRLSIFVGSLTSAFMLGSVTMAMLIGHSYLTNPGLAMSWLKNACLAFGASILFKCITITYSFALGAMTSPFGAAEFWDNFAVVSGFELFAVRALVGIIVPMGFCIMAYRAAAIRSTQSSTGILFPAMVVVFLGEMLGAFLSVAALSGLYV